MKCPDSKTSGTLDTEAVLPEEFVEFYSVETELQNFKAKGNLPSLVLPTVSWTEALAEGYCTGQHSKQPSLSPRGYGLYFISTILESPSR